MKVHITVERLPWHFLFLGAVFVLYGIGGLIISPNYILPSIVLFLGLLMVTSRQKLVIDTAKKVYSEFYWILGIKVQNDTTSYSEFTQLDIYSGIYREEYGKVQRIHVKGTMYKGYIGVSNDDPIFIGQSKNHNSLLRRANKIAGTLGIEVNDNVGE